MVTAVGGFVFTGVRVVVVVPAIGVLVDGLLFVSDRGLAVKERRYFYLVSIIFMYPIGGVVDVSGSGDG